MINDMKSNYNLDRFKLNSIQLVNKCKPDLGLTQLLLLSVP